MNYEQNTIDWQVGDLVIHDADAKREDMLMRVVGKTEDGSHLLTVYQHKHQSFYDAVIKKKKTGDLYYQQPILSNPKEVLHDPALFGIKTAQSQVRFLTREMEKCAKRADSLYKDVGKLNADLRRKSYELGAEKRANSALREELVALRAQIAELKAPDVIVADARRALQGDIGFSSLPLIGSRFAHPLGVSQEDAKKLVLREQELLAEVESLKEKIKILEKQKGTFDKLIDHLTICANSGNSGGFELTINYFSETDRWRLAVTGGGRVWITYHDIPEEAVGDLIRATQGANL